MASIQHCPQILSNNVTKTLKSGVQPGHTYPGVVVLKNIANKSHNKRMQSDQSARYMFTLAADAERYDLLEAFLED